MKQCTKCGEWKEESGFGKSQHGLRSYCKDCANKYNKTYKSEHRQEMSEYNKAYSQEHADEIHARHKDNYYGDIEVSRAKGREQYYKFQDDKIAYAKKYHEEHREESNAKANAYYYEHQEDCKRKHREWCAKNKKELNAKSLAYLHAHKEELYAKNRKWHKEHPENGRVHSHKRRARLNGNGGSHTEKEILNRFNQQNGLCFWCEKELGKDYQIDHIVPISKGGRNDIDNIVVTCPYCNRSKKDKLPTEWLGEKATELLIKLGLWK